MVKKSHSKGAQPAPRQLPWHWLAIVGAVLVIAAGVLVWTSASRQPQTAPQGAGVPKLVVDQTTVDEGYVQFNVPVRTAFRLVNAGNRPLEILGQPQVELVQGC